MPSLKVMIGPASGIDAAAFPKLAERFEGILADELNVPRHATNVLITQVATAPGTAPVFAELLFRARPDRDAAKISRLARALGAACPDPDRARLSLRAFPCTSETLLAVEWSAPEERAS